MREVCLSVCPAACYNREERNRKERRDKNNGFRPLPKKVKSRFIRVRFWGRSECGRERREGRE